MVFLGITIIISAMFSKLIVVGTSMLKPISYGIFLIYLYELSSYISSINYVSVEIVSTEGFKFLFQYTATPNRTIKNNQNTFSPSGG